MRLRFSNIKKFLCIISKFHVYQKKIQSYTPRDLKNRWMVHIGRKSNPTKSHGRGGLTAPAFNKFLPTVDFAHSPFFIFPIKFSARKRRKHKQASKRDRLPRRSNPHRSNRRKARDSCPSGRRHQRRRWEVPVAAGGAPALLRSGAPLAAVFHGGWVASKV